MKHRRTFGVAAFACAALHVLAYVTREGSLIRVLGEASAFDMATGWLAFLVFLPLAATSLDVMVRRMGPWWKTLQRAVYAAAVLVLLHWISLKGWRKPGAALAQFAPLAGLTLFRLWWQYLRPQPEAIA